MFYELTQDDLEFFEELTGVVLRIDEDGRRLSYMEEYSIPHGDFVFYYEFAPDGAAMWFWEIIQAVVPLSEMFGYATDLRSTTQGRATYSMQFSHYEEVPQHVRDEIVSGKF